MTPGQIGLALLFAVLVVVIAALVGPWLTVKVLKYVKRWDPLVTALIATGLAALATVRVLGFIGKETPAPPTGVTDLMKRDSATLMNSLRDSTQRTRVLDYGRGLRYDTRDPAYDKNLLDTDSTIGTVWPEENIHRTRRRTLERDGRIQLRIVVTSKGPIRGYWSYLPRDTSYVWVDSLRWVGGRGTARMVIISVNPADSPVIRRVTLHHVGPTNRALVRWTPAQCWSCEKDYWCK